MKSVTDNYKKVMHSSIRNRGYVSVAIDVVNQKAQSNATIGNNTSAWFSKPSNILHKINNQVDYATFEDNFLKADGKLLFLPDNSDKKQIRTTAFISSEINGSVTIELNGRYQIKGFTIHFTENYPTNIILETDIGSHNYTNDSPVFSTNDYLGNISRITITATSMVNGRKRMRINNVLMGVGLTFTNDSLYDVNLKELVNGISVELPSQELSLKIIDLDDNFNVDNTSSFVQFLKEGQIVSLSYGIEISENKIEWIDAAKLYLSSWQSNHGNLIIQAKDKLSFMTNIYSKGFKIYTRTAYDEAVSIFNDLGLEPDEYDIDECLKDITLTNPMPEMTHAECLQILCNASRCVLIQDAHGIIKIKANFETIINPEDIKITAANNMEWSDLKSTIQSAFNMYADFSNNFIKADGNTLFFPEYYNYVKDTGFISIQSQSNGTFTENPYIVYDLKSEFDYHGIYLQFLGTVPKLIQLDCYDSNGTIINTYNSTQLSAYTYINLDFLGISKIKLTFKETEPYSRVILSGFSFRGFSDYALNEEVLLDYPIGYKDNPAKSTRVRICSFVLDGEGNPVQVDDDNWVTTPIFEDGNIYSLENTLISTDAHARLINEWVTSYYKNNTSYDVEYRGDPRLDANDIVYLYSNIVNNLQVRIEEATLRFNGSFSGTLSLRREVY